MKKISSFLLLPLISLFFVQLTLATTHPILDDAHIYNENEIKTIQSRILKLRSEKNIWLVVQTIPSLNGLSIEDYSVHRFQELEIGQKKIDQGLLLIIAINDKKMRFEVGYGLEGVLPDILAKQILDKTLRPFLRKKEPFNGTIAAIDSLMALDSSEVSQKEILVRDRTQQTNIFFLYLKLALWIGLCAIFQMVLILRRGKVFASKAQAYLSSVLPDTNEAMLALRHFEKKKFRQQVLSSFVLCGLCLLFFILFFQMFPGVQDLFSNTGNFISLVLLIAFVSLTGCLSILFAFIFDSVFKTKTDKFIQSLRVNGEVRSALRSIYKVQKILARNSSRSNSTSFSKDSTSSNFSSNSSSRSDSFSQGGRSGGGGASSDW